MLPLPLPDHSIKNINFVGSIVRVVMTNATGSSIFVTGTSDLVANIIFDDVCCTGTFFPDIVIGGHFTANPANPAAYLAIRPWTLNNQLWNDSPFQFINYVGNHINTSPGGPYIFRGGMEIAYTGTSSFFSEWTGLYELHYNFLFYVPSQTIRTGKTCNFSYTADLYLEQRYLDTVTGTAFATGGNNLSFSKTIKGFKDIYFQVNEESTFEIRYNIINIGDDLDTIIGAGTPLYIGGQMNSGLISHLSDDGDGSITYFVPLGVIVLD